MRLYTRAVSNVQVREKKQSGNEKSVILTSVCGAGLVDERRSHLFVERREVGLRIGEAVLLPLDDHAEAVFDVPQRQHSDGRPAAVEDGATSLRDVRKSLGVASQCGKCGILTREILQESLLDTGEEQQLFYAVS